AGAGGPGDAALWCLTIPRVGISICCRWRDARLAAQIGLSRRRCTCSLRAYNAAHRVGRWYLHGVVEKVERQVGAAFTGEPRSRERKDRAAPSGRRPYGRLPARHDPVARGHAPGDARASTAEPQLELESVCFDRAAGGCGGQRGRIRLLAPVQRGTSIGLAFLGRAGDRPAPDVDSMMAHPTGTRGGSTDDAGSAQRLSRTTRLRIYLRLLAIQSSWNYE